MRLHWLCSGPCLFQLLASCERWSSPQPVNSQRGIPDHDGIAKTARRRNVEECPRNGCEKEPLTPDDVFVRDVKSMLDDSVSGTTGGRRRSSQMHFRRPFADTGKAMKRGRRPVRNHGRRSPGQRDRDDSREVSVARGRVLPNAFGQIGAARNSPGQSLGRGTRETSSGGPQSLLVPGKRNVIRRVGHPTMLTPAAAGQTDLGTRCSPSNRLRDGVGAVTAATNAPVWGECAQGARPRSSRTGTNGAGNTKAGPDLSVRPRFTLARCITSGSS